MLEMICRILIVLLAIVGVAELVRDFFSWLLRPDFKGDAALLLKMDGDTRDTEYILRCVQERFHWFGGRGRRWIVCIPGENFTEDQKKSIQLFSSCHPAVKLCESGDLVGFFEKEFANKERM